MGEELFDADEISVMFKNCKDKIEIDEKLALHIIHRFNICKDTMDTMPAFEKHINPLFFRIKEK